MSYKEYKFLVYSDLYRIAGRVTIAYLVKSLFFGETFPYNFWLRTCSYTKNNRLLRYCAYPFAKFFLRRLTFKLGISISPETRIGSGFYIGHFGGIVVNSKSEIGKNCNISHGVTLGRANRGRHIGYPILGDNVYIGPGAKIIGAVRVGNNVAIGANCVVTKDIPDNSVVVGVPGKVISEEGSTGYINRIDYEDKIS